MPEKKLIRKIAYIAAVFFVVYLGLKYLLPLVAPFLLAYIVSGWLIPVVKWISEKTVLSYKLSAALTLIIVIAVTCGLFVWLGSVLAGQVRGLSGNMPVIKSGLCKGLRNACNCCEEWFGIKSGSMYSMLQLGVDYLGDNYIDKLMPFVTEKALGICIRAVSFFIVLMFFILGTWLLLEEYDKIKNEWKNMYLIKSFFPVISEVRHTVGEYLKTQGIIICTVAVICSIGLFFIGNEYALLIGIIIALLDALPIIGSGSVLIPWAALYVIYGDLKGAAILAATYMFSMISREVLESKIMGHRTGLRPIYMLMSFYVGVQLFGIAGVLLGPVGMVLSLSLCRMLI